MDGVKEEIVETGNVSNEENLNIALFSFVN